MRRFIPVVFSLVITSVCHFTAAGTLTWPTAWLLLGLNFVASLANTLLMSRNPDLLAERTNVRASQSSDKLLVAWAMRTNTFFSAVLRIQKDCGHRPITTGPYALIRHPGYTGMATFTLATPLILNAKWPFPPAAATATLTAVRTALEDQILQRELEGYSDYARRTKYRLLPLIW